jgi:hypothetical protein
LYFHVALIGDRIIGSERSVLAFTPGAGAGGLIEQRFSEFARGRPVTRVGYLGTLPPEIVLQRARTMSEAPYSWTEFNCEHFVRYAHGVPVESPQLRFWAAVGLFGLISFAAAMA